jgi:hypothetical protein
MGNRFDLTFTEYGSMQKNQSWLQQQGFRDFSDCAQLQRVFGNQSDGGTGLEHLLGLQLLRRYQQLFSTSESIDFVRRTGILRQSGNNLQR